MINLSDLLLSKLVIIKYNKYNINFSGLFMMPCERILRHLIASCCRMFFCSFTLCWRNWMFLLFWVGRFITQSFRGYSWSHNFCFLRELFFWNFHFQVHHFFLCCGLDGFVCWRKKWSEIIYYLRMKYFIVGW